MGHDSSNDLARDCLICGESLRNGATLSLGALAACNQFEKRPIAHVPTHPVSVTECAACNLVQLSKFPSADFVRPRLAWIRYNEPFAHLDATVEQLQPLFPAGRAYVAMGVGPFDEPLLNRMAQRGFASKQLDLYSLLPQKPASYPYLESIQALLRPNILAKLATDQGTAHFVSCRYLLEHSHDPVASLQSLGLLIENDGLLVIEVPDSSKFLSMMDYSFIWEEHICYFTEDTFRACALRAGYEIVQFTRYPGDLEDALIFVLRASKSVHYDNSVNHYRKNSDTFSRYQSGFATVRRRYHNALQAIVAHEKKVAMFGAGHQSIMFVNALGLAQLISLFIDDAPEKIGYLIPGTSIPIVSSKCLESDPSIEVCLLGVAPKIEAKIRIKFADYINRGGRMYSIFPGAGSASIFDGEV